MGSDTETTLRIRCSRELYRRFKKIAADHDTYEKALEQLIKTYEQHAPPRLVKEGTYQIDLGEK